MTIAVEEARVRDLLRLVETIEDVASTFDADDERRAKLLQVTREHLEDGEPVRPVIAAKLLGLSEKTVRAWANAGVLKATTERPRLLIDLVSVHAVSHLLNELRVAGKDRDLLDAIWHRLVDDNVLDDEDLGESLEQMRRGHGRVLRHRPH
jgi:hypothetical protein